MLLLLISWILLYFLTAILGFGLLSIEGSIHRVSQTETVLLGLTAIVGFVQAASIFFPSDYRLPGLLLLVALLVNWRLANRPAQVALDRLRRLAVRPVFGLLVAAVLLYGVGKAWYFDSGMYHIPSIHWYERFRAIPGLGNLHGRLAFNSSFFVASAAFGFTTLAGQTLFALNGFLLLVFGAYVLGRLNTPPAMAGLRELRLLVFVLVLYYFLQWVSSPTPDVWATLLPLFVFFLWLDGEPAPGEPRFILLIALLFLCLTIKLGTLPLLLVGPILVVRHWRAVSFRQFALLITLGGLIVGPWLIRNVILSGYLLYPVPALDLLTVDWKIPLSSVRFEQNYVAFWARFHVFEKFLDPAKIAWPLARWLPIWWRVLGDSHDFLYVTLNRPLFVAACLSPLLMALQGLRFGWQPARFWQAYVVALTGFLFWFFVAPEFRFGFAFIWMTALLPWMPLLGRLPSSLTGQPAVWLIGLVLIALSVRLIRQTPPTHLYALVMPDWYGYQHTQAEGVRYQPHRTRSGLTVVVPVGPYRFEQRCYEIDQPCSPYFFDNLEKRGTRIEDGFRRRTPL